MEYRFGNIVLNTESHTITQHRKKVNLTNIEFKLLLYLAQHADKLCKREDILENVWGQRFQYDTGTIDVHLHSLRRKLGFERKHPIESIRNIGVILHTTSKKQFYSLNIQDFTIQWIKTHKIDFNNKQLIPKLHLDPFVSEITISPKDLHQMLDGILNVLLPTSQPGIVSIKSHLSCTHFSLILDINGTINELKIPINEQ
ncbi:MAG: winged helix-turn-helix transcriptional regulator [Paludibacteraceae bacterium]|nr:winged helix-turn-helix transcriptional regulator [Paludibacteraceae bacterium]MBR6519721.1 winged helix-turn-helix transcriptional regulator [Paludibacteraceae bacterium]